MKHEGISEIIYFLQEKFTFVSINIEFFFIQFVLKNQRFPKDILCDKLTRNLTIISLLN